MFKENFRKWKSRLSGLPPVCSQDCTDNKNGTFTCSCFDPRLTVVNGTHCVADKDREFKIFWWTLLFQKKKTKNLFQKPSPSVAILTKKKLFVLQKNKMSSYSSMPRPLGKPGAMTLVIQHPWLPGGTVPILCLSESPSANDSYITCGDIWRLEPATKTYAIDFDLSSIHIIRFDNIGNNWIFTDASYYVFICKHNSVRISSCRTVTAGDMGTIQDMKYDGIERTAFGIWSWCFTEGIWRIDVASGRVPTILSTITSLHLQLAIHETLYFVDIGARSIKRVTIMQTTQELLLVAELRKKLKWLITQRVGCFWHWKTINYLWMHWIPNSDMNLADDTSENKGTGIFRSLKFCTFDEMSMHGRTRERMLPAAMCDDMCIGHINQTSSCFCRDGYIQNNTKNRTPRILKMKNYLFLLGKTFEDQDPWIRQELSDRDHRESQIFWMSNVRVQWLLIQRRTTSDVWFEGIHL